MRILKVVLFALACLCACGSHADAQNRSVMEGIPASSNTIFVSTPTATLLVGTSFYHGVTLPVGSIYSVGNVYAANLSTSGVATSTGLAAEVSARASGDNALAALFVTNPSSMTILGGLLVKSSVTANQVLIGTTTDANNDSIASMRFFSGRSAKDTSWVLTQGDFSDSGFSASDLNIYHSSGNASLGINSYIDTGALSFASIFALPARGSRAVPKASKSGDDFRISLAGYNGSAFTGSKAVIDLLMNENWSTTANGSSIRLSTTRNGTTGLNSNATFDQNGLTLFANASSSGNLVVPSSVTAGAFFGDGHKLTFSGDSPAFGALVAQGIEPNIHFWFPSGLFGCVGDGTCLISGGTVGDLTLSANSVGNGITFGTQSHGLSRIDSNGLWGINTLVPTAQLDVNGNSIVRGDLRVTGDVDTRFQHYDTNINQVLISTNIGVVGPGAFISIQDSTEPAVQQGLDLLGYSDAGTGGGEFWSGTEAMGTTPPSFSVVLYDANSGLFSPNALRVDSMTLSYAVDPPWVDANPLWNVDHLGNSFNRSTATAAEFALQSGDVFTSAPHAFVGSSDAALVVGGIKGTGAATLTYSGFAVAGGLDVNGHVSNSAISAGGGIYNPANPAYRGTAQLLGGSVMGAYDHTRLGRVNGIASAAIFGGSSDGGGANVNISAGISGGYNGNTQLAPGGGNSHIALQTGDNLGGDSISDPSISTRTTDGGETLTFSINGEAPQTITLGADPDAASICDDIQAKVRALTAADPANQYAYSGFNAQRWPNNSNALALVAPGDYINQGGPSSLVITGGTFAPLAGLGLANGGTETSGSIGIMDFGLGQGIVPGAVDAMQLDLAGLHLLNGSYYGDGSQLTGISSFSIFDSSGNINLGSNSSTPDVSEVLLGFTNTASGGDNTVIGDLNNATGTQSTSVGSNNNSRGNGSTAVGFGNNMTFGSSTDEDILAGYSNSLNNCSQSGLVGSNNTAVNLISCLYSFAFGSDNHLHGFENTAVGRQNSIYGGTTYILGSQNYSIAGVAGMLAYQSSTTANNTWVIGNGIIDNTDDTVMIGPSDASKITIGLSGLTVASGVILSSTTQGSVSCNAGTGVLSAKCTDQHCTFAAGAAATSCTYTFGTAWPNAPDCVAGTNAATPVAVSVTSPSTTQITITSAVALTGDNVTFICSGAP